MVFDLVVERAPFISGLKNLEEAILAFLYVCFVTNMEYPKVQVNNNLIYPLTVLFGLSSRWSFCLQCNENFFENPEPFDVFTDLQLFIPLFYTYFFYRYINIGTFIYIVDVYINTCCVREPGFSALCCSVGSPNWMKTAHRQ